MLELFRRLGLPEVASAHGAELDHMLVLVHWLMLVLFIGWGAFFIIALVKFRASKNPVADYAGVTSHRSTYVEIAVIVAEAALLVGFAIPLWMQRVNKFPPKSDALIVNVVAEQFLWNVQYPGKDGVFGKTSAKLVDTQNNTVGLDKSDPHAMDDIVSQNQLHLPVNKPALIYLSSKDVIHSFGIPEMRVKQDAVPGLRIPLWFTPTVTTAEMRKIKGKEAFNYEIACAQLCGIGHYRMRGFATIDTPEEFETWIGGQTPVLAGGGEDDVFN